MAISQNRLSEIEANPGRLTVERLLELANLLGPGAGHPGAALHATFIQDGVVGVGRTPRARSLSVWVNGRLAGGKNKHYLLKNIQRRHFNALAAQCGVGETAEPLIEDILAATPAVTESVQQDLPKGFPQHVLDSILKGLAKSAKQLEAMPVA